MLKYWKFGKFEIVEEEIIVPVVKIVSKQTNKRKNWNLSILFLKNASKKRKKRPKLEKNNRDKNNRTPYRLANMWLKRFDEVL